MRRLLTLIVGALVGVLAARWFVAQVNPSMMEADSPGLAEHDWLQLR
jgi:hypothetical protein